MQVDLTREKIMDIDRCVRQQHDELDQHESERVKCDLYSGATAIDKSCAANE